VFAMVLANCKTISNCITYEKSRRFRNAGRFAETLAKMARFRDVRPNATTADRERDTWPR